MIGRVKRILTISKWEFFRPAKSKASIFSFIVLIGSMLILPLSITHMESSSESIGSIGTYKIFRVGTDDMELAKDLSNFSEFDVLLSDVRRGDIYITSLSSTFFVDVLNKDLGGAAIKPITRAIRDINTKKTEDALRENISLRSSLKPVIVTIIYINPHMIKDTTGVNISAESADDNGGEYLTEKEKETIIKNISASGTTSEAMPSDISVPFPFKQSFLAFLLIAPLFFFSMFFSSSIIGERTMKRGEAMLSLPMAAKDILFGKMLPYVVLAVLIASITAYLMDLFSIYVIFTIATLSIILFSAAGIVATITRSPESVNFTLVFLYLAFFAYLFYPTMFIGIDKPDISSLSPLTAMTAVDKTGALNFFLLSLPNIFTAFVLFWSLTALYKEDVLFGPRSVLNKISDIYEKIYEITPRMSALLSGMVGVPIALMSEIFLLFLLFPLGSMFLPVLIIISVSIEEVVKVYGIKVLIERGRVKGGTVNGMIAGFGFFIGEKTLAWIALTKYITEAGQAFLFAEAIIPGLIIHLICSGIAGYGIARAKGGLATISAYLAAAILIHLVYDLLIIYIF